MRYLFFTFFTLFVLSCSEEATDDNTTTNQVWDSSFYAPQVGEKLIYREAKQFIHAKKFRPISRQEIGIKTIERVQTYEGPEAVDGKIFHRFSIYNDGEFSEGFVLHWTGEMLLVTGSFLKGQKLESLSSSIPIAHIDMTAGSYWHWPPNAPTGSGSRVIDFEPVKVPAGTFEAHKVSVRKSPNGTTTLRDYWFVPKIGIVKERYRFYSGGLLRTVNTIELTGRELPKDETSDFSE